MGRVGHGRASPSNSIPGDEVVSHDASCTRARRCSLLSENGYGKRTPVEEYRVQSRGGKGIKAMQLTDKTGLLAALLLVREEEDVMIITDDGTIIRTAVADISTQSRSHAGRAHDAPCRRQPRGGRHRHRKGGGDSRSRSH